jgi:hypothetical protein
MAAKQIPFGTLATLLHVRADMRAGTRCACSYILSLKRKKRLIEAVMYPSKSSEPPSGFRALRISVVN